MGRPNRVNAGGLVYHVLNRGNGRVRVFYKDADYETFETILAAACKRYDMRLLAYCLMPNHWHLVLWPRADGDLSAFVGCLTLTHTRRWHAHRGDIGTGHVYQGRFKSVVVQADEHLARLCRYVERNALRAPGGSCRGLAVGQPVAVAPQRCPATRVVEQLAYRTTATLAIIGQPIGRRATVGSPAMLRKPWSSVRQRTLGATHRPTDRPRDAPAPAWPPTTEGSSGIK